MSTVGWGLVALLVLLVAAFVLLRTTRGRRPRVKVQSLPAKLVQPYESRLPEIERLFASQPREAVAAAKLLVDDMLNRMGYPVRISNEERVRDLRGRNRRLADSYRSAANLRSDPTTEQLRQALQLYVGIAHTVLNDAAEDRTAA